MYCFDDFELDTQQFELRQSGVPVQVEPRALELVRLLIENRDRVVDRDEIIRELWDGRIVSDAAISTCLKSARRAVGDNGKSQTLIKTVHGRGFRFVGSVQYDAPQDSPAQALDVSEFPSLIILPMQVFGEADYLQGVADGLVELLTTVLTRVPLLSIVSRAASFATKGQPVDMADIRDKFGVWYMLEGSLQETPAGVRANFQLIDVASGHHIWARRIEQARDEDISAGLLNAVLPILEPQLVRAMVKDLSARTTSVSAPALTLEAIGMLSIKGWNRPSFAEAERLLDRAIELQPDLALAHAYLALVLGLGHRVGLLVDRTVLSERVNRLVEIALDLDGLDSTILGMTGCALADIGERERALPLLRSALELNPDNAQARTALGATHLLAGNYQDAMQELQEGLRASPMDPRRAIWRAALATATLLQGDAESAEKEALSACDADHRNHIPRIVLAATAIAQGDTDRARSALEAAVNIRSDLTVTELKAIIGKDIQERLVPLLANIQAQRP